MFLCTTEQKHLYEEIFRVCILAIKSGPYLVHLQLVRDIRRILSITGQTKPTILYFAAICITNLNVSYQVIWRSQIFSFYAKF